MNTPEHDFLLTLRQLVIGSTRRRVTTKLGMKKPRLLESGLFKLDLLFLLLSKELVLFSKQL